MADNVHEVVKLLAARMESHPEEFPISSRGQLPIGGRWAPWLAQAEQLMNEAERELIYGKAKEVIFQRIHEEVLDELLNGEQRRAEEKAAHDAEMQRLIAQSQVNPQSVYSYQQATSTLGQIGISSQAPSQPLVIQSGGKEAMRIQANGDIRIGNETLNEGLLKNIKKALGL